MLNRNLLAFTITYFEASVENFNRVHLGDLLYCDLHLVDEELIQYVLVEEQLMRDTETSLVSAAPDGENALRCIVSSKVEKYFARSPSLN